MFGCPSLWSCSPPLDISPSWPSALRDTAAAALPAAFSFAARRLDADWPGPSTAADSVVGEDSSAAISVVEASDSVFCDPAARRTALPSALTRGAAGFGLFGARGVGRRLLRRRFRGALVGLRALGPAHLQESITSIVSPHSGGSPVDAITSIVNPDGGGSPWTRRPSCWTPARAARSTQSSGRMVRSVASATPLVASAAERTPIRDQI